MARGVYAHSRQVTHGQSVRGKITAEYRAYNDAKARCNNLNRANYYGYGGRGIKFLFESFEQFFLEIGKRPTRNHTLDRINNNGHYEPGNIRWASWSEQVKNRRKKAHCKWGHLFSGANVYLYRGAQQCRECAKTRTARRLKERHDR
jgi:hypothetical protein